MGSLTGVRCLSIGRALARTECGLAFAARAISKGQAVDFQMGLNTVRQSLQHVSGMMPSGAGAVRKIVGKVSSMDRELRKDKKISKGAAKGMFKALQDLKLDVDRLFAAGASECPGDGKRKRG